MLHGKCLEVTVAFDLYLEVAEGELDAVWHIVEPLDFWQFREKLSIQMLEYCPIRNKYPGDVGMRTNYIEANQKAES
jgi:hypothetical protein